MATLFPFNSIVSRCVSRRPSGVMSLRRESGAPRTRVVSLPCTRRRCTHYSMTSSSTMFTYTSKPAECALSRASERGEASACKQRTSQRADKLLVALHNHLRQRQVSTAEAQGQAAAAAPGRTQMRLPTHLSTSSEGSNSEGLLPCCLVGSAISHGALAPC